MRGNPDRLVLAENRDVVEVFLASSTPWRVWPSGALAGLDYSAARAARGMGVEWASVFGGLRIMEAAVLDARGPA